MSDIISPCIGVCRIDEPTGYCEGCFRSVEEIQEWTSLNNTQRHQLIQLLPLREGAVIRFE